ncbi:hypothetical protein L7F22_004554 [Adiantum nelumboides]|nr:hypothetical protein [Adiantum nelumboides]
MADAADEQEAMLERFLTRLALTEDEKLENVLAKLLPFAISCLATRQSTRQKVMDILMHINKRVKDQPSIKLPLRELLALYQNEKSEPIVKNFSLVYLEMAFDRHPKDDLDLAPELLKNLSQVSVQQQDILLRLSAKSLEKYAFKSLEGSCAARYTFLRNPDDRDIFVEFCLQTIVYQSSKSFLGLSKLQAFRISGKELLKGDSLVNRKVGMLNVISELNLSTEIVYPLFLVASVDSNNIVSKRGEELLKKITSGANFEDPVLIKKLFSMFQGTIGNSTSEDTRVFPASPSVKEKILSVFVHSIAAANSFPATLHCIFDCIFGTESFPRLKQSGIEFANWVFKHARDEQMKAMAPIILSGVSKLLDSPPPGEGDTSVKQLRMFAYQSIGQLGKRAPHLFRDNLGLPSRLFEAFKLEPLSLKFTVQEAFISLASAYESCSEVTSKEMISLLLQNVSAVEGEARFCSVWWANHLYQSTHCASRFVCMLGASDERLDVRDMALEGLFPQQLEEGKKPGYPLLSDMLDFIFEQQLGLLRPSKLGEQVLFFKAKTYEAMITFLLSCYDVDPRRDVFEERFLLFLEHGMVTDASNDLHLKASKGLLTVASGASQF